MLVLYLIELMEGNWELDEPCPGDPYDHNLFKQYNSDHHPILFMVEIPTEIEN